jgi:hypothetical protein
MQPRLSLLSLVRNKARALDNRARAVYNPTAKFIRRLCSALLQRSFPCGVRSLGKERVQVAPEETWMQDTTPV